MMKKQVFYNSSDSNSFLFFHIVIPLIIPMKEKNLAFSQYTYIGNPSNEKPVRLFKNPFGVAIHLLSK